MFFSVPEICNLPCLCLFKMLGAFSLLWSIHVSSKKSFLPFSTLWVKNHPALLSLITILSISTKPLWFLPWLADEVPTNTCKTFTLFSSFSDRYKKPIELAENHLEFRSEVLNDFIFLLSRQWFKFWKSLKAWPAFLFCVLWPSRLELAALTVIF